MQKTREAIDTIEEEITSACEEAAEDLNLEYGKSLKCEQDAKSKQYLFRVTRAYDKVSLVTLSSCLASVICHVPGRGPQLIPG